MCRLLATLRPVGLLSRWAGVVVDEEQLLLAHVQAAVEHGADRVVLAGVQQPGDRGEAGAFPGEVRLWGPWARGHQVLDQAGVVGVAGRCRGPSDGVVVGMSVVSPRREHPELS